jgi:hypothetical protein
MKAGRNSIGVEINEGYATSAYERIVNSRGVFSGADVQLTR